jgi:hypothetical protein
MVIESDRYVLLEQASQEKDWPPADRLVETLLDIEREAIETKEIVSFDRLLGTWRLQFITGTKKARGRTGILLGSGRYLPRWLTISLTYHRSPSPESLEETDTITDRVELGALQLSLSGPARFLAPQRILAFDFTRMTVTLFGATLYSGYIRGGEAREAKFFSDTIKTQAFFAYFLLTERAISARGRGGGLALWVRD